MDVKPRASESLVPGAVDADWPCITRSREIVSDWEKADPHANQWSKGGHWVLKAVLNFDQTSRDRGEKGKERLQIVKQKKARGMASSVWP